MTTERTTTDGPVAGWYPDPLEQADLRWYDGSTWTDQTRAHPTADAAGDDDAPTGAAAGADDELSDADLLAMIAAADRRRRIVFAIVALVLVALVAWLVLGRGDDQAGSDAQDAPVAAPEDAPNFGDGVQGRVEGDAGDPIDPLAQQEAASVAAQRVAFDAIERVAQAMRSCSIGNEDGSYAGCTSERLLEVAPSLQSLLDACGQPGGACVRLIGPDGYEVKYVDDVQPPRTWIEIHAAGADGAEDNVTRTCEPAGCTPTGTWDPDELP